MARCAVQSAVTGKASVSCASRSLVGASRRLNQVVEEDLLEVARRAAWIAGAARQHGNLCRF
ncbi:hypothetical protein A2U01_0006521 [Trifolium medium]|uniref:Uncharacterized protein n=1 Tax=Trifolium medium TaxID=97028 RepID=A0A392MDU6_9FABA|nr:hypothetical protein [Trifolium medium]